ncbi:MAG: alpha/beta fold hydrolase [Dehalococcoidia bacterium]
MADVTDAFIRLRGLNFHYRDWGGHGQLMVLLHGLASTCRIWNAVAPHLATRFWIVALDQRGHGESDKPEDGYDFDTIAADLHAFVEALGLERPVLVGHSWGGNVALHYAALRPEVPRGLVLVDGGFLELAARPGMTWERVEKELAPPDFSGMTKEMLLAEAQARELGRIWRPEVEEALLANFEVADDGTLRPRLRRVHHMRILRALWEHRPSTLYRRIACPVLMVAASQATTDERAARFLEAKRQAVATAQRLLQRRRLLWMEETIHDVPLHRPQELAQAVADFVGREVSVGS